MTVLDFWGSGNNFAPLPWAQKSKLGQTKKITPRDIPKHAVNTKIQTTRSQMSQNLRAKVSGKITPKYQKKGSGAQGAGRVKNFFGLKHSPNGKGVPHTVWRQNHINFGQKRRTSGHTYIHPDIHTYIRTYIHTYTFGCVAQ